MHGLLRHDARQRQNRNIILVTHFWPPFSDILICVWISSWPTVVSCDERSPLCEPIPPLRSIENETFDSEDAFWEKKKTNKKCFFFFMHVLLSLELCVTGPIYKKISLWKKKNEKKRCFFPLTQRTNYYGGSYAWTLNVCKFYIIIG